MDQTLSQVAQNESVRCGREDRLDLPKSTRHHQDGPNAPYGHKICLTRPPRPMAFEVGVCLETEPAGHQGRGADVGILQELGPGDREHAQRHMGVEAAEGLRAPGSEPRDVDITLALRLRKAEFISLCAQAPPMLKGHYALPIRFCLNCGREREGVLAECSFAHIAISPSSYFTNAHNYDTVAPGRHPIAISTQHCDHRTLQPQPRCTGCL